MCPHPCARAASALLAPARACSLRFVRRCAAVWVVRRAGPPHPRYCVRRRARPAAGPARAMVAAPLTVCYATLRVRSESTNQRVTEARTVLLGSGGTSPGRAPRETGQVRPSGLSARGRCCARIAQIVAWHPALRAGPASVSPEEQDSCVGRDIVGLDGAVGWKL